MHHWNDILGLKQFRKKTFYPTFKHAFKDFAQNISWLKFEITFSSFEWPCWFRFCKVMIKGLLTFKNQFKNTTRWFGFYMIGISIMEEFIRRFVLEKFDFDLCHTTVVECNRPYFISFFKLKLNFVLSFVVFEPKPVNQVKCINLFYPIFFFLYPLKRSENQMFSEVFRGYRKRTVGWNVCYIYNGEKLDLLLINDPPWIWSQIMCLLFYGLQSYFFICIISAVIYLLKGNNRNTKVWNMFKVNDNDSRTTSLASFWCLYC